MLLKFIKILLVINVSFLVACSQQETDEKPKQIKLWVAPNETQEEFWKVAVDKWNTLGKGTPVYFTTIPATGSSEQAILTALVADNAPDISTNIFAGFAAQMVNLKQLVDLTELDGFQELIEKRQMQSIMQGWQQNDQQFVFPLYSNPTLVWWRKDILQELGIEKLPETFNDVYEISEKYSNKNDRFGMQIISGNSWADRWFDFISYYYASSKGARYIDDNKMVYNNTHSEAVLSFITNMFKNGWTSTDFDAEDPLVTGTAVGAVRGPWDISYFQNMYPETLKNIAIGPMIGEGVDENEHYTFADTKGLVIFKSSKLQQQSFEFIKWVFSDDQLSLLWLEKTGLPPARGDLLSNPIFTEFYQHNPLAKAYASYVDVAVPPAFIENTIDVQKIMSVEIMEPVQRQLKSSQQALYDAEQRTNNLLERLK